MTKYMPGTDTWDIDCRQEVAEFAEAMEAKLRKNDHKTGWQQLPVEALRRLMMLEIEEYNVAREFFGPAEAMAELVDIANFAMMLRDRIRIEHTPSMTVDASQWSPEEIETMRRQMQVSGHVTFTPNRTDGK